MAPIPISPPPHPLPCELHNNTGLQYQFFSPTPPCRKPQNDRIIITIAVSEVQKCH